jgi:hypothetical protein
MKTRLILLAVAVVTATVMLSWQFIWVQPEQDCAKQGGIWDSHERSCFRSVTIAPLRH